MAEKLEVLPVKNQDEDKRQETVVSAFDSVIKFSEPWPHCGAQGCSSSHLVPDIENTDICE